MASKKKNIPLSFEQVLSIEQAAYCAISTSTTTPLIAASSKQEHITLPLSCRCDSEYSEIGGFQIPDLQNLAVVEWHQAYINK